MTTPQAIQLLATVRANAPQISWLSIECAAWCSIQPRTIEELVKLTGTNNGQVNRSVRALTPWWDPRTQAVIRPTLHLLQRRTRPKPQRGHRIHLTSTGRQFFEIAGLAPSL